MKYLLIEDGEKPKLFPEASKEAWEDLAYSDDDNADMYSVAENCVVTKVAYRYGVDTYITAEAPEELQKLARRWSNKYGKWEADFEPVQWGGNRD